MIQFVTHRDDAQGRRERERCAPFTIQRFHFLHPPPNSLKGARLRIPKRHNEKEKKRNETKREIRRRRRRKLIAACLIIISVNVWSYFHSNLATSIM